MSNYRVVSGETPPKNAVDMRKRKRWHGLFFIVFIIIFITLVLFIQVPRTIPASGYLTTEKYAEIYASAAGTIVSYSVHTGATVTNGQILVQLDNRIQNAALDKACSLAGEAAAELTRREIMVREQHRDLKEKMAETELRLKNKRTRLKRIRELVSRGLAAGSVLESAVLEETLVTRRLATLKDRDLSIYEKELNVLRQQLKARQGMVLQAEIVLTECQVRAPMDGLVVRYEFSVGERIQPDRILYEIFGGNGYQLKLRINERFASIVKEGQSYRAKLATCPEWSWGGGSFSGKVLTMRGVIQREQNKNYRVIYCDFDPGNVTVMPGINVSARISYGQSSLWRFFVGLE